MKRNLGIKLVLILAPLFILLFTFFFDVLDKGNSIIFQNSGELASLFLQISIIFFLIIFVIAVITLFSSDIRSKVFQKEEKEVKLKADDLKEQKKIAEEIIKEIELSSEAHGEATIKNPNEKEPTPKEVENFKMTLAELVELIDRQKKQLLLKPNMYLLEQIEQSDSIARLILNRSGVYLIYGIVMAMVGIIAFISINIFTAAREWTDQISRVAGLLFIQAIAFYLLKQHRVMMEEYRYYEGIKRRRQDAFTMLMLFKQSDKEDENIKYLIDKGFFSDYRRVLNEKETTEVLETGKQNDANVLESLTKLVEQAKGLAGGGK